MGNPEAKLVYKSLEVSDDKKQYLLGGHGFRVQGSGGRGQDEAGEKARPGHVWPGHVWLPEGRARK